MKSVTMLLILLLAALAVPAFAEETEWLSCPGLTMCERQADREFELCERHIQEGPYGGGIPDCWTIRWQEYARCEATQACYSVY